MPLWRALFGFAPLVLDHGNATGTILDVWNRWDTLWYDDLAQLGYNLHGPNDYKNVVFFPLYPLLTRALHDILAFAGRDVLGVVSLGSAFPTYLVPGLIVANLCSLGALIFFYRLVRLDYGRATARRAVTLLALFPTAFFLVAAYSEGTFLLCAIAFFYALRLERWWQAGLWGLLAAATRPPGAVLFVPFLIAWAEAHPVAAGSLRARTRLAGRALAARLRVRLSRLARRVGPLPSRRLAVAPLVHDIAPLALDVHRQASPGRTPRRMASDLGAAIPAAPPRRLIFPRPRDWPAEARRALRNVLPAIAIPLGLALFMIFLYRAFGNPLLFSTAQQAWWRTFAPPWETLYVSITWPLGDILHGTPNVWDPAALHDLAYALGGLAVTWLAWRRLPRAQAAYLWLLWVVLLSAPAMLPEANPAAHTGTPHHDVLMSLPRMLLMFFPLFAYLGLRRRLYPWLAGLFALALPIYAGVFLAGIWIS